MHHLLCDDVVILRAEHVLPLRFSRPGLRRRRQSPCAIAREGMGDWSIGWRYCLWVRFPAVSTQHDPHGGRGAALRRDRGTMPPVYRSASGKTAPEEDSGLFRCLELGFALLVVVFLRFRFLVVRSAWFSIGRGSAGVFVLFPTLSVVVLRNVIGRDDALGFLLFEFFAFLFPKTGLLFPCSSRHIIVRHVLVRCFQKNHRHRSVPFSYCAVYRKLH